MTRDEFAPGMKRLVFFYNPFGWDADRGDEYFRQLRRQAAEGEPAGNPG